eukprot:SAG31_NODE_2343_length_5906_cov_2.399346_3_plen_1601_part_00
MYQIPPACLLLVLVIAIGHRTSVVHSQSWQLSDTSSNFFTCVGPDEQPAGGVQYLFFGNQNVMQSGWEYRRHRGESDNFLTNESECPAWGFVGGDQERTGTGSNAAHMMVQEAASNDMQNIEFRFCEPKIVRTAILHPVHRGHEVLRGALQYMSNDGLWHTASIGERVGLTNVQPGLHVRMKNLGAGISARWRIHDWRIEGNQWLDGLDLEVVDPSLNSGWIGPNNTCVAFLATYDTIPRGYIVENPNATTVRGLGELKCANGFVGTPIVNCPVDGGVFDALRGCTSHPAVKQPRRSGFTGRVITMAGPDGAATPWFPGTDIIHNRRYRSDATELRDPWGYVTKDDYLSTSVAFNEHLGDDVAQICRVQDIEGEWNFYALKLDGSIWALPPGTTIPFQLTALGHDNEYIPCPKSGQSSRLGYNPQFVIKEDGRLIILESAMYDLEEFVCDPPDFSLSTSLGRTSVRPLPGKEIVSICSNGGKPSGNHGQSLVVLQSNGGLRAVGNNYNLQFGIGGTFCGQRYPVCNLEPRCGFMNFPPPDCTYEHQGALRTQTNAFRVTINRLNDDIDTATTFVFPSEAVMEAAWGVDNVELFCSEATTFVVKADGRVLGAGSAAGDMFADGLSSSHRNVPTQVGFVALTDTDHLGTDNVNGDSSRWATVFLKRDGRVFGTGYWFGQLPQHIAGAGIDNVAIAMRNPPNSNAGYQFDQFAFVVIKRDGRAYKVNFNQMGNLALQSSPLLSSNTSLSGFGEGNLQITLPQHSGSIGGITGGYSYHSFIALQSVACVPGLYSETGNGPCTPCGAPNVTNTAPRPGATSCLPCPAGTTNADSSSATGCDLCPSGRASATVGAVGYETCLECPPGTYAVAGSTVCLSCAPGHVDRDNNPATPCDLCLPGFHMPTPAAAGSCAECLAGQYAASFGVSNCTHCLPGRALALAGYHLASGCQACLVGSFAPVGSSACHPCPEGTADTDGDPATECSVCPMGSYSTGGSSVSCTLCTPPLYDHDEDPTTPCTIVTGNQTCRQQCIAGFEDHDCSTLSPCTPCLPGFYSTGGVFPVTMCVACEPGQWALTESSNCSDCPSGQYDHDLSPTTECHYCQAGKMSFSVTECRDCAAGQYGPDGGGCLNCSEVGDNQFSVPTSAQCSTCQPGKQPTLDRSQCEMCITVGDSYYFSPDGGPCRRCEPGSQPNAQRQSCVACVDSYSADGRRCISCDAGSGPSANHSHCDICTGISYSLSGVCQVCIPPREPSSDRRSCAVPYSCPAGSFCPLTVCAAEDCQQCETGTVSLGQNSACTQCTGPGQVANAQQTACEQCPAGSQPHSNRSHCILCTNVSTSAYGVSCEFCSSPNIVNDQKTTCLPCRAGEKPNINRTACIACSGNTFSRFGIECQRCAPGTAVNVDMTQCNDISDMDNELVDVDIVFDVLDSSDNIVPTAILEVLADPAAAVPGSPSQLQLLEDLSTEMAAALGIAREAITNAELAFAAAGRRLQESSHPLLFRFALSTAASPVPFDAAVAIQELSAQLADENSVLRNSETTSRINTERQLQFAFICPLGMVRGNGEANCRFCAGGTPDPTQPGVCNIPSIHQGGGVLALYVHLYAL